MQSKRKQERETLLLQDREAAIQALCDAAEAGDLAEVKRWLELDPSFSSVPLLWALAAPHPNVFIYLLPCRVNENVTYKDYTLAEYIALYCQWSLIEKEVALQALAEDGVLLNPFFLAACRGSTAALSPEALAARDTQGNNVAHYASANGQLLLLQQLKAVQPALMVSANNEASTLLLTAACNGHLPVVQ